MLNVTILCGNPKAESRTLHIATSLVDQLLVPGSYEATVVDLAEHCGEVFAWPSDVMSDLVRTVGDSDLLFVASPTYKATYTGLLKAFLDRYPTDGLAGVTAIPVMTGGSLTHAMGPDVNLRPLLVELGASTPTKGLYFVMSDMDALSERLQDWVAANSAALHRTAKVAAAVVSPGDAAGESK